MWYDGDMEHSEPREVGPRPELKNYERSELFTYAKSKVRWIKATSSTHEAPVGMGYLVDELEKYLTDSYAGELPELHIEARDIVKTANVGPLIAGSYTINVAPLPLHDLHDENDEVRDTHKLRGTLYGFHLGEDHELRMYISVPQEDKTTNLMGGIYSSYHSVAVEGSTIDFEQHHVIELLNERLQYLEKHEASSVKIVEDSVQEVLRILDGNFTNGALRLSSQIIAGLVKNEKIPVPFKDALLEVIELKLQFYRPHDLIAASYREVLSEGPTFGFKIIPSGTFENILPRLELIGDMNNRYLAVCFEDEKQERSIQVPVFTLTSIRKAF